MSLSKSIIKAISSAKAALGDLVVPMTLVKKSGVYDTTTGKVTETESLPIVSVAITQFEFQEVDGVNVRSDDVKGFIFDTDQAIDTEDKLMVNDIEYTIVSVKPYIAGSDVVINEVHLRK